ncbi:MAG: hypothetical protein ACI9BK_001175, partial [Acidimicrobiales bacterium]
PAQARIRGTPAISPRDGALKEWALRDGADKFDVVVLVSGFVLIGSGVRSPCRRSWM